MNILLIIWWCNSLFWLQNPKLRIHLVKMLLWFSYKNNFTQILKKILRVFILDTSQKNTISLKCLTLDISILKYKIVSFNYGRFMERGFFCFRHIHLLLWLTKLTINQVYFVKIWTFKKLTLIPSLRNAVWNYILYVIFIVIC